MGGHISTAFVGYTGIMFTIITDVLTGGGSVCSPKFEEIEMDNVRLPAAIQIFTKTLSCGAVVRYTPVKYAW